MNKKLSLHDWELVSQYIDNQLSARDRRRFESRLQKEPALQTAIEQMRQTRHLVRSLPQVRAPRQYTLTPEMVPRPALIMRLLPTFQFASALATILFVLVVVGDLFGLLSATSQDAFLLQRAAEPEMALEVDAFATPTTPSFFLDLEGESTQLAAEDRMEQPLAEEAIAPEAAEQFAAEPEGEHVESGAPPQETQKIEGEMPAIVAGAEDVSPNGLMLGGGEQTPTVSPVPGTVGTPTPSATPEPTPTPSPTPTPDSELAAETPVEPGSGQGGLSPEASRFLVRVIEVTLAAAALIFAAIVLWLRRQAI